MYRLVNYKLQDLGKIWARSNFTLNFIRNSQLHSWLGTIVIHDHPLFINLTVFLIVQWKAIAENYLCSQRTHKKCFGARWGRIFLFLTFKNRSDLRIRVCVHAGRRVRLCMERNFNHILCSFCQKSAKFWMSSPSRWY